MSTDAAAKLLDIVGPSQGRGTHVRHGTISAINADGSLMVVIDGAHTPIRVSQSATPTVGAHIDVLVDGTKWMALGGGGGGGSQGPQGPKGDKGDKGDTGATGAQGPQGPAGATISPYTSTPANVAATGAAGSSGYFARGDHVHPDRAANVTSSKGNNLKVGYATKSVSITSWTATGNGQYGQPSVSFTAAELGLTTILSAVTQKASGGALLFSQQNAQGGGYVVSVGGQSGTQSVTLVCIAIGT